LHSQSIAGEGRTLTSKVEVVYYAKITDIQSSSSEHYETISLPKLTIQANTPEQEFVFLRQLSASMLFFNQNGYKIELPETPKILEYFQNGLELPDDPNLLELYMNEYSVDYYQPRLQGLMAHEQAIRSTFPTFVQYHNLWGFRIFPEYQIRLTRYGPGGFYRSKTGVIEMLTFVDGSFKRPNSVATVVHEIFHIGIDDIVKKYDLTHWEKEGLVDKSCMVSFPDMLPDYQVQKQGDRAIFDHITVESMKDLPKAVKEFKAEQRK